MFPRSPSHSASRQRATGGAIVLCGGSSRRMGRPKWALPFGNETVLQRVCRIVESVADPVAVICAGTQSLPPLGPAVRVVCDDYESCGPLAGIATGLGALRSETDHVFVTGCDSPLLRPAFIQFLFEMLETADIVVPTDDQFDYVLASVYHTSCESSARKLLAEGQRRPQQLLDACATVRVPTERLREVDPDLQSLCNMNTPTDYANLLEIAGF